MRASDKKRIHRMEVEDDLGIKRGVKSKFVVPIKLYKLIKLCLIIAIPVVYFICSPLLILVVLAYFGLIFVTNNVEKNLNQGLRKDLHVHLPKIDSILCILLIIITIAGTVVSSVSTTQKKSMFEGMNSTQLEEVLGKDFDDSKFTSMRIWNKVKDVGTLLTGTRYFFQEERGFRGGIGGFRPEGFEPPEGFTPPEGFSPPSGDFSPPDMNEMLSNMPFSIIFQSIIKAVDTGMLILIVLCGLTSFRKIKKFAE